MIFPIALLIAFVLGTLAGIASLCRFGLNREKHEDSTALGSVFVLIALFFLFQSGILIPFKTFIPPNIEGCVNLKAFILGTFFSLITFLEIYKSKELFSFIYGMSLLFILVSSYIRAILELYF